MSPDARRLEELRAQAKHAKQRRDLYVARTYGPSATSPAKLRELEAAADAAAERLAFAEREAGTAAGS